MSLILEALKKSEAERQLGRAPGLMSPTLHVTRRRGPSPWWGVLGLALAIAAGAGWWVMRDSGAPGAVQSAAQRDAASTAQIDASSSSPTAAASPALPAAAPAPTPALAEHPAPAAPTEHAAILPRDPEFDSVERESVPIATQPAPVPPPPAAAPALTPAPSMPASTPPPTVPATAPTPPATTPASTSSAISIERLYSKVSSASVSLPSPDLASVVLLATEIVNVPSTISTPMRSRFTPGNSART